MGKSLLPLPFKTHLARLTENIGTPLRMKLHDLLRERCFTEWETRSLSK